MSLQTRLSALITAIGADIKAINSKIPEVNISVGGPSSRTSELLWVDTDAPSSSAGLVPAGGANNDLLKKLSATDYDVGWATGTPPSGAAGGDLAGTYPNPTIGAAKVGASTLGSDAKLGRTIVSQVVGNGANLSTTWTVLTNLSAVVNVPVAATCRVDMSARIAGVTAAWVPIIIGLSVSPTPSNRVKGNAPAGGAIGATQASNLGLVYVHNAGQVAVEMQGWDSMDLNASTNYTFQVVALCTAAASAQWAALNDNHLMVTWWPK